jgi:hypothetical protein
VPSYRYPSMELVADLVLGVVRDGDHFVEWGWNLKLSERFLRNHRIDTCHGPMNSDRQDRKKEGGYHIASEGHREGIAYICVVAEGDYPSLRNRYHHMMKGYILTTAFFLITLKRW